MSFYTASVGARQQQERLNVQANNIANVNTGGFKAEKPSFAQLMYGNVNGINNAQLPRGSGTRMVMADTDFAEGPTMTTGMAQDYSIQGDGFFALVDPATNTISYTRDGSFTLSQFHILDEAGEPKTVYRLSDGQGRFVLSREGGIIDVADGEAEQPVGVFDFVNVDGMQHVGGNRFVPVDKNGQVRMGSGKAQRGTLEASNTDLAYEMSKIIEAQRSFSYALKMVQTSDEVETTINSLRA